jgi:hypothetical protein
VQVAVGQVCGYVFQFPQLATVAVAIPWRVMLQDKQKEPAKGIGCFGTYGKRKLFSFITSKK